MSESGTTERSRSKGWGADDDLARAATIRQATATGFLADEVVLTLLAIEAGNDDARGDQSLKEALDLLNRLAESVAKPASITSSSSLTDQMRFLSDELTPDHLEAATGARVETGAIEAFVRKLAASIAVIRKGQGKPAQIQAARDFFNSLGQLTLDAAMLASPGERSSGLWTTI